MHKTRRFFFTLLACMALSHPSLLPKISTILKNAPVSFAHPGL